MATYAGVEFGSGYFDFSRNWLGGADGVRGTFVKQGTNYHEVVLANGSAVYPLGVLQNDPKTGTPSGAATIRPMGLSLCIAGVNNITVGQDLVCDSTGRVTQYTKLGSYPTAKSYKVGVAQSASTAVDQLIEVLVNIGEASV